MHLYYDISQVFRDLLRQLSSPSSPLIESASEINGVFVMPGHVFVATSSKLEKGRPSSGY